MHLNFAVATAVLIFLCLRNLPLDVQYSTQKPKNGGASAAERKKDADESIVYAVYVTQEP